MAASEGLTRRNPFTGRVSYVEAGRRRGAAASVRGLTAVASVAVALAVTGNYPHL